MANTSCPAAEGWKTFGDRCYTLIDSGGRSLRDCMRKCASTAGAGLACIESAQQNAFIQREVIGTHLAWHGAYQALGSQEPKGGWTQCTSGPANFSHWVPWAPGEPNNWSPPIPEDCALMYPNGNWDDTRCLQVGLDQQEFACLCEWPQAGKLDNTTLDALERRVLDGFAKMTTDTYRYLLIIGIISVAPTILFVAYAATSRLARARGSIRESPFLSRRPPPPAVHVDGDSDRPQILLTTPGEANARMAMLKGGLATLTSPISRLKQARRRGWAFKLILSTILVQVGWPLMLFGILPVATIDNDRDISPVMGVWLYWNAVVPVGISLVMLAISPVDVYAVYFSYVCFLAVLSYLTTLVSSVSYLKDNQGTPLFFVEAIVLAPAHAVGVVVLLFSIRVALNGHTRALLSRVWLSVRLLQVIIGAIDLLTVCIASLCRLAGIQAVWFNPGRIAGHVVRSFAYFACCAATSAANRGRFRRVMKKEIIVRFGSSKGSWLREAREAATISALLGSSNPDAALALAAATFRALSYDRLTEADFMGTLGSEGALTLSERTIDAELGNVDCFLSHSWQDEGSTKFAVLSDWAAEFSATHDGNSPLLWLDAACIDQANISASLILLPLYVSGCRTLLILAGDTYSTRLWCLMELFTFIMMGGTSERVCFRSLRTGDRHDELLCRKLFCIDSACAKCYLVKDHDRLLGIIEASFGDCQSFNARLRSFFETVVAPAEGEVVCLTPAAHCH